MHFVAHLAEVVDNATGLSDTGSHILNATVKDIVNHTVNGINATVETMEAAGPSKLSVQMPWIELGLIPIVPVLACYLFTKLADFVLDRIARRHGTAPRLRTHLTVRDNHLKEYQPAQDKTSMQMSTPSTRHGDPGLPRGRAAESNMMAGANAENPVLIGNSHAFEQGDAATLIRGTRSRVFKRGGIRGGVRSSERGGIRRVDSVGKTPVARLEAQGPGWWFDAIWY